MHMLTSTEPFISDVTSASQNVQDVRELSEAAEAMQYPSRIDHHCTGFTYEGIDT